MEKCFQVAELTVTLESALPLLPEAEDLYRLFEVPAERGDAQIGVRWRPFEPVGACEEVFALSSEPVQPFPDCRLCRDAGGLWLIEANGGHRQFTRRVAVLQPDFSRGDLFVEVAPPGSPPYPNPFRPPLDRVFFVNLLARREGMMIHACGVIKNGQGYVFPGASGAGKSTMARLWAEGDDVTVLGEECLILRQRGSEYWVYGTPWVGETHYASSQGAPIAGIYLLRHAPQNIARLLPLGVAAGRLLERSYLALYEPAAIHRGLDLCLGLVRDVPVYDFGFRPDASAVETVRGIGQDD